MNLKLSLFDHRVWDLSTGPWSWMMEVHVPTTHSLLRQARISCRCLPGTVRRSQVPFSPFMSPVPEVQADLFRQPHKPVSPFPEPDSIHIKTLREQNPKNPRENMVHNRNQRGC